MSKRPIEMHEVRIPLEAIKALTPEGRYTYYLLGHAFNELNFLQKLVGFSMPKHDDRRDARLRPEVGQVLFLFRLATSKVWEAKLALDYREVSATLRAIVLPEIENGLARLKEVQRAIKEAPWIAPMRNGLGFHYPEFSQWKAATTPDPSWTDDLVFLGETTGNTFYDAAETIAQAWMYGQYAPDGNNIRDAVEPMIEEMIKLVRLMNNFLEDVLGVLIGKVLLDLKGNRRVLGKVAAPAFVDVKIPFWTSDKPAS